MKKVSIELRLKSKKVKKRWQAFYWIMAIFIAGWCVFLLANETKLIFKSHEGFLPFFQTKFSHGVWLNFFMTIIMVCAMVGSSFYTVFRLKFSDYLQLIPEHTDCVTFCSFTGLI